MNAESIARQARKFEKQGQRGQAIEICESFLAKFPKNKRIQQQLSGLTGSQNARRTLPADQEDRLKKSFNSGAYQSLLPQIGTLIDRYPECYFLWNLLGSTHLKLNDPRKAEAAFSRAVSIDAMQPNALVGLGDSFRCMQDHRRALESYLAVLKQHPDKLQALNNLGTLLGEIGHYEQAADALSKAHALAPENSMILFNLGNLHRASNHLPQAADCLKKTLALMPQSVDARYNLALIQTQLGDLPEAVQNFETLLETDPDHDSARAQKLHQMAHMCDWTAFAEFAQQPPDFGARRSRTSPFPFLALEDHPKHQLQRSKCYAARFVPPTPAKPLQSQPAPPSG